MRGPNLIAAASCRFADNLYPMKHRALQQFVGVEARPVVLDVAPDPVDRFPASYRTEHTHITQAALGRGRENLPPSRPKGPKIRRPFLLRWT